LPTRRASTRSGAERSCATGVRTRGRAVARGGGRGAVLSRAPCLAGAPPLRRTRTRQRQTARRQPQPALRLAHDDPPFWGLSPMVALGPPPSAALPVSTRAPVLSSGRAGCSGLDVAERWRERAQSVPAHLASVRAHHPRRAVLAALELAMGDRAAGDGAVAGALDVAVGGVVAGDGAAGAEVQLAVGGDRAGGGGAGAGLELALRRWPGS
jgi:hypothetical protein